MTHGEQLRLLHVEEVSSILLRELEKSLSTNFHIIHQNVGSGIAMSIADFATNIFNQQDTSASLNLGALPYRDGEVMRYVLINTAYISGNA